MILFARTDRSALARWWWTVDRGMLGAFLTLMVFGLVLIATASPPVAEHLGRGHYYFLLRHIVWLVPALGVLIGASMLEQRHIWRVSSVLFALTIIALVMVLFTGIEIKGAQRWLRVAGFSIQPSEFIKPSFIIVAAWLMALQKRQGKIPGSVIAAGLYFLVITLLLLQPDIGMTVIVTASLAAMIFLAGFPFRFLIAFGLAGIGGLFAAYFGFDHVRSRIDRFINPESGDNFQVQKSIEAFQNGGLFGTGPGQGSVKLNLPDAHADFIFAVGGEEMGLIFVLLTISIFAFILLRGFNRLMDSDDIFVVLAAGGLLAMFGLQAFVHMGSSLHLLPAKGMTLPFISYGGSSVLSVAFSMGVLLALLRGKVRSGIAKGGLSLFTKFSPVRKTT